MASTLNILSGLSRLFIGTAATDVLPADSVAFGGTWTGTWRDVGYLEEGGVTVNFNQTFNPVNTSQSKTPVLQLPGASDDSITANLYEMTLQNIKDLAGRGSITTLAPVGATPGHDILTLGDATTIRYVAIGFEGVAPPNNKSNPRRILFPTAQSAATISYNQGRDTPASIAATFSRLGGTGNDATIQDTTTT